MTRVPIADEYRPNVGGNRFPQIEMTKKGEIARFCVIEKPDMQWVHFLKAPVVEDGEVVKEVRKRKSGEEYETYRMDFIGRPICLGADKVLRENGGLDPDNCPACEIAKASAGDVDPPEQRFAVNVVQYGIAGGGDSPEDIALPFGAQIRVWAFTGNQYLELLKIQKEIGDLRYHDITLTCEDPNWKRFKMGFKMKPGYQQAPEGYMRQLLSNPKNRATDEQLQQACGRSVSRQFIEDDVAMVLGRWRQVRQIGSGKNAEVNAAQVGGGSLDESLGALLENTALPENTAGSGTAAAQHETAVSGDPFAEFLPGGAQHGETIAQDDSAAAEKAAAEGKAAADRAAARQARAQQELASDKDPFAELSGGATATPAQDNGQAGGQAEEKKAGGFNFEELFG